MKVQCGGSAGGNVIPSMFLFQGKNPKDSFVLECGDDPYKKNGPRQKYDFAPRVETIVISHAHTDHFGALTYFVEDGFNGQIFSTSPTKQIGAALLSDNFPENLVDNVFDLYGPTKKFLERFEILEGVYATLYPAQGHILGASMVRVEFEKEGITLLFTGDFGNANKGMLDVTGEVPKADIVIMESTYGWRKYHPKFQLSLEELYDGINETYRNKGNVYVPVLSIHKLQEALYYLNLGKQKGAIPKSINIVADSTLGEEITKIYSKKSNRPYFSNEAKKFFDDFPQAPFRHTTHVNKNGRNVILASSGLDGLKGKFRKYLGDLSSENNSVAVLSHRMEGSLLDDIALGKKRIGVNGGSIKLNAKSLNLESCNLSGFSSHADATQLIELAKKTGAKKFILVHGENDSREKLKQMLIEEGLCDEKSVFMPALNEEYDLTDLHSGAISYPVTDSKSPAKNNPDPRKITLFGQDLFLSKPLPPG